MSHRILVVDDEPDITALVAYHLTKEGFTVSTADNGNDATRIAREQDLDLVVLDLMLPGVSGFDVLSDIRQSDRGKHLAVIMLTARREEPDRIRGLELGADDYVVKPFSPAELVLRVKAVLRRLAAPAPASPAPLVIGPIAIDRAGHTVSVNGGEIDLTAQEYRLLLLLAERVGRLQSRAQLLADAWDANPEIQTRTVDMHVQRLRAKLGEPAASMVETVRGFGYRLRPPEHSA